MGPDLRICPATSVAPSRLHAKQASERRFGTAWRLSRTLGGRGDKPVAKAGILQTLAVQLSATPS